MIDLDNLDIWLYLSFKDNMTIYEHLLVRIRYHAPNLALSLVTAILVGWFFNLNFTTHPPKKQTEYISEIKKWKRTPTDIDGEDPNALYILIVATPTFVIIFSYFSVKVKETGPTSLNLIMVNVPELIIRNNQFAECLIFRHSWQFFRFIVLAVN